MAPQRTLRGRHIDDASKETLEYGKKLKYLKDKDPQSGMPCRRFKGLRQRPRNKGC
jgi:hypothetical protein